MVRTSQNPENVKQNSCSLRIGDCNVNDLAILMNGPTMWWMGVSGVMKCVCLSWMGGYVASEEASE